MAIKYFVVDAFANEQFKGNPAGVCLLEEELKPSLMQRIAFENNLSDTAFVWKKDGEYYLRWFTPKEEIPLCGHATLGTGYVLFEVLGVQEDKIDFHTQSGIVSIEKKGDTFWLDFPVKEIEKCEAPEILREAIGVDYQETFVSRNLIVILESEEQVANLQPNFDALKKINHIHGVVVTAPGNCCDFVSRFFIPNTGITEDPVTGSTHTELMPYWTKRLGKDHLKARQLSQRGGDLECILDGDRVRIGGQAVLYLTGEILL